VPSDTLENNRRVVLASLRFACLAADQRVEDARAAGSQLAKALSGLQKVGWTFAGVRHFVSQHPAFAVKSAEWVRMFEALEQGNESNALAALGVPE
jgi:hypothetical protein